MPAATSTRPRTVRSKAISQTRRPPDSPARTNRNLRGSSAPGPSRGRAASWPAAIARRSLSRSSHLDLGLDGEIERGGDEAGLLRLFGQLPCLRLVARIGLDLQSEQQPGEAEVSVGAHAGDAVSVDLQLAVGETSAGGEAGEGDSKAGGRGCDEEVFGAPGCGIGAAEDGRRGDFDRRLALHLCGDAALPDPLDREREVELFRPDGRTLACGGGHHAPPFMRPARGTTSPSRRLTSAAMGASCSLPTIESIRSGSIAEMCVSLSRL